MMEEMLFPKDLLVWWTKVWRGCALLCHLGTLRANKIGFLLDKWSHNGIEGQNLMAPN